MKTMDVMIVGVGGQGTLLASRVLGEALIAAGCDVKVSEVHGMSQRGGSVVTYVTVSYTHLDVYKRQGNRLARETVWFRSDTWLWKGLSGCWKKTGKNWNAVSARNFWNPQDYFGNSFLW